MNDRPENPSPAPDSVAGSRAGRLPPLWLRLFGASLWLGHYTARDLRSDLVAGLTVGVILVPQSMGYAMIAGLPPIYGLYASLVPLVVYALFGTARQLAAGIVALDMLIVAAGVARLAPGSPQAALTIALTLALLAGAIHIAIGTLRLGFIAEFISRPVIVGFVTAAPLLIGLSQLDDLLGLPAADSRHIASLLADLVSTIGAASVIATTLGVGSLILLIVLRRLNPAIPAALVALLVGGVVVWALRLGDEVATVGTVATGFPPEFGPSFNPALWRSLLPTALTLVLIQLVTVVSLGKTTAPLHGGPTSANREITAIGVANSLGSIFGSPPVSASFSRTAVNVQAGARSPLANGFAALLVGLSMLLLTGVMAWIPLPTLAAVILVAALGLVDFSETRRILQLRRAEGVLAISTFAATLLIGIEEGVLLGIGASMMMMLYKASRPHVAELGRVPESNELRELGRSRAVPIDGVVLLRVDGSLSFASADFARRVVLGRVEEEGEAVHAVLLDARGINDLDTTAVSTLHDLLDNLEEHGVRLYLTNVKGRVRDLIERSDIDERLGSVILRARNREILAELAEQGIAAPEAGHIVSPGVVGKHETVRAAPPPDELADESHRGELGTLSRIDADGQIRHGHDDSEPR